MVEKAKQIATTRDLDEVRRGQGAYAELVNLKKLKDKMKD